MFLRWTNYTLSKGRERENRPDNSCRGKKKKKKKEKQRKKFFSAYQKDRKKGKKKRDISLNIGQKRGKTDEGGQGVLNLKRKQGNRQAPLLYQASQGERRVCSVAYWGRRKALDSDNKKRYKEREANRQHAPSPIPKKKEGKEKEGK